VTSAETVNMEAESVVDSNETKAAKAEDSSIQCKEEASPSDDSKIVTSNGDLADTQCATNTSNNRSSQETNDAEEVTKEATNPDDHLTIATKPENVQPDPDSDDPNPDSKPDNNDLKNHNNEQSDHDSDDLDEKMDPYTFSEDEEEEGDTNQMGVGGSASLSRYSSTDKDSIKNESMTSFRNNNDSSDLDGDDEDRLVIADDEDSKRDPISLKENVLNLKSDKPRKKHLRFNGMSEEEVAKRQLPDLLKENLDIVIIGINPGLYAAFKGHHYAGPGNHFCKS